MTGKTCVVTGGAGSIGLAAATLFVEEGANVMLVGRNAENLIALGRHARPEEIARMALFLASDRSNFSTVGVFMADGGMGI